MINVIKKEKKLLLIYMPEFEDEWIKKAIKKKDKISIKRMFEFSPEEYIGINEQGEYIFLLGKLIGNYYLIEGEKLYSSFDVYIDKGYPININTFKVNLKDTNVFSAISKVYNKKTLYIGGENEDISIEDFKEIMSKFPTIYEKELYTKARIENVIKNYLEIGDNNNSKLNNYVQKKQNKINNLNFINEYDVKKYEEILKYLKEMINNYSSYTERDWQDKITKIITLIMPQYIFSIEYVTIKMDNRLRKQIDIVLVNANGNIDIIEVKRYDEGKLIGKNMDSRGNYRPSATLSSAIVQAEKYAYLCSTYIKEVKSNVEKKIKEKYKMDFKVNIINPKTIIIIGNSKGMNKKQKEDFELIRRMYANVLDIITYEDLEERLNNLIKALKLNINK